MSNSNESWILIALAAVVVVMIVVTVAFAAQAAEDFNENQRLSKYIEQVESQNESLDAAFNDMLKINNDLRSKNKLLQSKLDTIEQLREAARQTYTDSKKDKIKLAKVIVETETNSNMMPLPAGMTNTFRCEDFRKFTDTKSDQYQFQLECVTDMETGIRFYRRNGIIYLCAALGGAYCSSIGEAYHVTLKCGYEFNVVSSDFKHADQMTKPDPNDFGDPDVNYDEQPTTSVIEFVYDAKIAPKAMIMAGTMSYFDKFGGLYGDGGNIVSMERLGKVWGTK